MRFLPNPSFEAELQREAQYHAYIESVLERIKTAAESIAPGDGYYKQSFVVYWDGTRAYVGSSDFAAHLIEWGSINNPPYAVLRRAAAMAGFELELLPKP